MSRIILATKNRSKYISISRLLASLPQKNSLKIDIQPLDSNIQSPIETGKSSDENCQIKAQYYEKIVSGAFIVIDDEIDFSSLLGNLAYHEFHSLGTKTDKTSKEITAQILQLATEGKSYPLSIIRYFGCINNGKKTFFNNVFNCYLKINNEDKAALLNDNLPDNPLNNFLYTMDNKRLLNISDRTDIVYSETTRSKLIEFISSLANI